jgi:non-ribosomal peptide synthetase component F
MTASYAATRVQFERPIGSFQAVHTRAADAIDVEAMRLTTRLAARRPAEEPPASDEVAVAKYWAARAGNAGYAAGTCTAARNRRGLPLHRYYLWAKQLELTPGRRVRSASARGWRATRRPRGVNRPYRGAPGESGWNEHRRSGQRIVDLAPDWQALVCGGARRTYAQLEERSNRLANHLASLGFGPGDHIGIYAYNCVEFVESMLAAYKLRAVPINVNYRYVEDELRYLFDNADLKALIHHRRFTPRIAAVKDEMPLLRHRIAIDDDSGEDFRTTGAVSYSEALASASPARSFGQRSPDDLYVLYTGGTTGMPKGVMWRHHDVIFTLGGGIDHATGIPHQAPEDLSKKMGPTPMVTMAIAR